MSGVGRGVSDALDRLAAAAGGPKELLMLNALAIGADALVFDLAMKKGISTVAVLPLPEAQYAGDFAPGDERGRFLARLGQCAAVWAPGFSLPRPDCYAMVGAVLVRHASVLLAVWDGEPPRGPNGGTAHVVDMALGRADTEAANQWAAFPLPAQGRPSLIHIPTPNGIVRRLPFNGQIDKQEIAGGTEP